MGANVMKDNELNVYCLVLVKTNLSKHPNPSENQSLRDGIMVGMDNGRN